MSEVSNPQRGLCQPVGRTNSMMASYLLVYIQWCQSFIWYFMTSVGPVFDFQYDQFKKRIILDLVLIRVTD